MKKTTKSKDVKKNITVKDSKKKLNFFLSVFIILVCLLIILFIIDISLSNKSSVEEIPEKNIDANFVIEPITDSNLNNVDVENIDLDQVLLPESELLNQYQITSETIDDLKTTYPFAFNQSMIEAYDFKSTEIGDIILEFKDYVLVYNVDFSEVKSIWLIQVFPN